MWTSFQIAIWTERTSSYDPWKGNDNWSAATQQLYTTKTLCCKNPFLVAWLRKCLILRMHLLSILASFYNRSYSITKAKCWYEPYELRLYGLFFLKGVVEALVYSSEGRGSRLDWIIVKISDIPWNDCSVMIHWLCMVG